MNPFSGAVPIWHPERNRINQTILFETEFEVPEKPKKKDIQYICYLYVHTQYALYLNGSFVDSGSFPGYKSWRLYDTLDVTPWLHPGTNRFQLEAYSQGEDSFTVRFYGPEALFSLWQTDEAGNLQKPLLLSSPEIPVREDVRYRSSGVPKISPQLSFSFDFDETKEPLPFAFSAACPHPEETFHALAPRPVPKLLLRNLSEAVLSHTGSFTDSGLGLPAVRMQENTLKIEEIPGGIPLPSEEGIRLSKAPGSDGVCLIVHLPTHLTGYLFLELSLEEDTDLLLGWGEHLEDGRVRTRIGGRSFAAPLRLRRGRRVFFYPFKRIAVEYLELMISAPEVTLHHLTVREAVYPLATEIPFPCGDSLHRQIYEVCLKTLRDCMHEHYEDCPWREQALYTMDSRNQMLCGYYAFHETAFPRVSLKLIALSLRPDHLLELISPGKADITIPSFSAVYLIQCEEYLRYSSDRDFLEEILPVLEDIAGGLMEKISETGLIPRYHGKEYWNFYEWQEGLSGSEPSLSGSAPVYDAPMNAFAVMAFQALIRIKQALGEDAGRLSVHELEQAVGTIRNAYHAAFFDPEKGVYSSFLRQHEQYHYAELTQALSLLADLVPESLRPSVLEALAFSDGLLPVTLSHSIFRYEALMTDPKRFASVVFASIGKDYGYMLDHGARTFWETLEGASAFDQAGSLCHGWSAVPVYFYQKYCADSLREGSRLDPSLTGIPMENQLL